MLSFISSAQSQDRNPDKVYKVAILPFLIHSQENLDYLRDGIFDILASRISVEGKIVVIDRSLVEKALYEEKPMRLDEEVAAKIGARVEADYVILGSITKVGDYFSLDSRLLSITEDKPPLGTFAQTKGMDDVMNKLGGFAEEIGAKILGRKVATRAPAERGSSGHIVRERSRLGDEGFRKSQVFGFEIRGLDIGDVDGDKKNEIVVMDRSNLYIFKYDGDKLTLFQKIQAEYQYTFLTLDVADVNNDGIAEIIVSAVVGDDVRSFILEWEEGRFRKITEKAGWFFRVLEHPKEGPILMAQAMSSEGLPSGNIYKMVWKKKSFEKGPRLQLPRETSVFGLAMGDLRGTGKPDVVFLDPKGHLNVFTENGKDVWQSREVYGTNNYYETQKKKIEPYLPAESPPYRVVIPGRILLRDLDGDGRPQIVVNKNEFASGNTLENTKAIGKTTVFDLVWEETRPETNWRTREINGYIADYQIKEIGDKGERELVAGVIMPDESGLSGLMNRKTESTIMFFKLD